MDQFQNALVIKFKGSGALCISWTLVNKALNQLLKSDFEKKTNGTISLVERWHIGQLQPPATRIAGLWNGKIRARDWYHSFRLFKTIPMVPSRKIYVRCSSVILEGKIWKGIWKFMAKTHFQWIQLLELESEWSELHYSTKNWENWWRNLPIEVQIQSSGTWLS